MAVIESAQAQAAAESAARLERVAAAREEQGRADRAAILRERSARASESSARAAAVANRNVPEPSGPVEYVRNSRGGRRETATYEPVSVRRVGDQVIVERRDLLRDPYASGGVKREPYVKERLVLDASGEVVEREVYDTYRTESGRTLAYLARKETPEEIRETRRNDAGEKLRETVTDKASGESQRKSFDPGAKAAQESELAARGLSKEEIASLSAGQRRAILDPSRASRYTSTRVPAGIVAKATAGSVREVSDASGKTYQGQVKEGVFLGTRSVSEGERRGREKEARMLRMRAEPGVSVTRGGQFGSGRSVLIQEGGRSDRTAREVFEDLGAPKRELLGDITFGRERRLLLKREKRAPELSFPLEGEEAARRTKVYWVEYAVPNAATARFADFPLKDDKGGAVEFPAVYRGLKEEREEFARVGVFDKLSAFLSAKAERVDRAGVALAAEPPSILTVRGNVGRLVRGVQLVGKGLEKAGEAGAPTFERLAAENPEVSNLERAQSRAGEGPGAFALLSREAKGFIGRGGSAVSGFLIDEGRLLQERPVTAGAGEAVMVGTVFGAVARGAQAIRAAGYVVRGGQTVKRAGALARTARVVGGGAVAAERSAGLALGAGFAYGVGQEVYAAPTPFAKGEALARPVNELIGFGLGARAGVRGMDELTRPMEGFTDLSPGSKARIGGPFGPLEFVVGERSARERSGRISKAELRNRKQARALAPKYEVSKEPGAVTFELRGKARARSEELRVLSATVETREALNLEFANKQGVQIFVKRQVPAGLRGADVALPGVKSPRIEPPQGRERPAKSPQVRRERGSGSPLVLSSVKKGRARLPEVESGDLVSQVAKGKRRGVLLTPETEAPYRSRDKSPSSRYVQRVPVVTVGPEYGAPDLRGAPAFLRERAREFSRGSPEDRRLRAVARLRELAAERARELERSRERELPKPAEVRVERAKPKARPRILERSRPLEAVKLGEGTRLRAVPAVSAGLGSRSLSRTLSVSSSKSIQRQEFKEKQDLGGGFGGGGSSEFKRRDVRQVEPREPTREPPRIIRNRPTPEPLEPIKPKGGGLPDLGREKRLEPGFTVLVKRGKEFRSLTNVPLTRKEALIAGSRAVDVGASQTFKIVRAREGARPGQVAGSTESLKKFKDVGGGVFRERRGRALIDTVGELSEITFKGLRARKVRA